MSGQQHPPAALPPGKTRYPFYGRLGGPQGLSGQAEISEFHSIYYKNLSTDPWELVAAQFEPARHTIGPLV